VPTEPAPIEPNPEPLTPEPSPGTFTLSPRAQLCAAAVAMRWNKPVSETVDLLCLLCWELVYHADDDMSPEDVASAFLAAHEIDPNQGIG
jgi:hypothetical protein